MKYTLYIKNKCISCEKILTFIKDNQIKCEVVNINQNQSMSNVPFAPVLYEKGFLLAYGPGIISYLHK